MIEVKTKLKEWPMEIHPDHEERPLPRRTGCTRAVEDFKARCKARKEKKS